MQPGLKHGSSQSAVPGWPEAAAASLQVGQTSDAILALEDEAAQMVGSAEIHAALAALLYEERPSLAFRAEEVRNGGAPEIIRDSWGRMSPRGARMVQLMAWRVDDSGAGGSHMVTLYGSL